MSDLCHTCGQVLPHKKEKAAVDRKQSKMLRDDLGKAQAAIEVLKRFVQNTHTEPEDLREAAQLELERMVLATSNHKLLWSIYRRGNNKGLSSYSS
jgi:hypothetical protein